jgi:hypothetical protein
LPSVSQIFFDFSLGFVMMAAMAAMAALQRSVRL